MTSGVPLRLLRGLELIGLAAAIAAASPCFVMAASAAQGGGMGLRPGHFDPADPATRAYFKPTVAPGGTFSDDVVVTNTSDAAIDLFVSGVDGLTAQTSGAVYANRQDPVKKAGAWVTPAAATLTVGPHREASMGFTVRVPASALAGDHLAGIAFENAHPTTAGGNFAVTEVVRGVMGVQVQVPGPAQFHLRLDGSDLQSLPGIGTASVVVTMGNDGGKLGKPALSVSLTGPDGYRKTVDRQLDTLLPGDTIAYPLVWPDTLKPGDYSIAIKSGDGVTHQGSAHLSAALSGADVLGATEVSGRPGQTPASSRSRPSGSKFPSWVLVIVAVAGVGGGVVIGRRGRRPRPPSDAGAGERPLASR